MNIKPQSHNTRKKVLFLSDLDGTWLSKNTNNRAKLDREILEIRDEYSSKGVDLKFGYITARPPQRVNKEHLPTPDWTVTYNGAQLNKGGPGQLDLRGHFRQSQPNEQWIGENEKSGFSTERAAAEIQDLLQEERFSNLTFKTVGEVVDNPSADANEFTAALCFAQDKIKLTEEEKADLNENGVADIFEAETFAPPRQIQELAGALHEALENADIGHQVSPPYLFHGKPYVMFDVASPVANKGDAVTFLQKQEQVAPEHTIVAGDGGNDLSMMTGPAGRDEGRRSIVVGGDTALTSSAASLKNAILRPQTEDSSLGILSGLRQHLDAIVLE